MGERRSPVKAAEWAKRVERWKSSGLTAKEFAQEMGYSAKSLMSWSWRLRREHRGQALAKSNRKREPDDPFAAASWVELTPTDRAASVEVAVGDYTVRIDHGFDAALLREVLAVLRECA